MEDPMASFSKLSIPREGVEPWGCPRLAGIVARKPFEVSNTIPNGNCLFACIICSKRVRQVLRANGMELYVMALRTWLAGQMAGDLARQVAQDTCYASDQMPAEVAGVLERHGVSVCLLTIGMEGTTLSRLDGKFEEPCGIPLILVRQGERQHFDLLVTDEVDRDAASAMHAAALANEAEHAKGAAADQTFLDALSEDERKEMLKQFAAFEAAKLAKAKKEEEDADRRLAEVLQEEMRKEEQARAAAHAEAEAATARLLAEEAKEEQARAAEHAKAEKATALFLAKEDKEEELRKANQEVETLRFLLAEDLAEGAAVASELAAQEQRVSRLSFELSQLMAELL